MAIRLKNAVEAIAFSALMMLILALPSLAWKAPGAGRAGQISPKKRNIINRLKSRSHKRWAWPG